MSSRDPAVEQQVRLFEMLTGMPFQGWVQPAEVYRGVAAAAGADTELDYYAVGGPA